MADQPYPFAAPFTPEQRNNPTTFNTPAGGGQGGTSPTATSQAQVQVALSTLTAAQYPATTPVNADDAVWQSTGGFTVYDGWQVADEYADDAGTMVAGVCNSETGVNRQIDYGSPALTLYRRWMTKSDGAPPILPPKYVPLANGNPDPNWVYDGGSPAPHIREIGLGSDGVNFSYEAKGVWIFQCIDPSMATFQAAIPPFLNAQLTTGVAGWYNNANIVASGGPGGGSQNILGGQSGSGSSPLGGGTLPSPVPP